MKESLIEELRSILGPSGLLVDQGDLLAYSIDGTWLEAMPDCVVLPTSTQQVAQVMSIANRELVPVVPRGGSSNLSGGTIPINGGMVMSLTRMNKILEIDPDNLIAIVQPGVITHDLQNEVRKYGLYYPPDPSSVQHSTIGGNVAENAGGLRCLKYGVTSKYVLGMEYVTPTGEIGRTGGRVIKNVTGYQLEQLLVGSEGTLAIITEITLRLIPYPKYRRTLMAVFGRLEDAGRAVSEITRAGIIPAAMELMDNSCIQVVEDYLHIGLPIEADAMLLVESDGYYESAVEAEIRLIDGILSELAAEVTLAEDEFQAEELWRARRSVSPAVARIKPNKLGEDVCVPRSAVPDMIRRCQEIARRYDLKLVIYGHAGDGNIHPNILFDKRDLDEVSRVQKAAAEIFQASVELGGTLTGEHGIGLLKRGFLGLALDQTTIGMMRAIKQAIDPNNILNPGKIFPDEESYLQVPFDVSRT